MYETIKSYNEYRKNLKAECVYETANKIMEAVNLAERYALKECGDWMEAKMVERDMKEIKRDTAKMYEEAQKMKEDYENFDPNADDDNGGGDDDDDDFFTKLGIQRPK